MMEWYWQGKTEVLGEKHYTAWELAAITFRVYVIQDVLDFKDYPDVLGKRAIVIFRFSTIQKVLGHTYLMDGDRKVIRNVQNSLPIIMTSCLIRQHYGNAVCWPHCMFTPEINDGITMIYQDDAKVARLTQKSFDITNNILNIESQVNFMPHCIYYRYILYAYLGRCK